MTLEDVIAAALRWPDVAEALAPALSSTLVVANPFRRQICEFLGGFLDEHGSLPKDGDWQAWAETLDEQQARGVRKTLRRLQKRDLSSFTPAEIVRRAAAQLRQAATDNAVARLNRLEGDKTPALQDLAAEIERISLDGRRAAELVSLEDVVPEEVDWLWPGRIPLGKLTILDGDPGLGKSTMALDLAARLSTGEPMPDDTQADLSDPAGTVLLTAEDGLADTIRPRLDVAGADPSRVTALRKVGAGEEARFPTIRDEEAIREAVREVGAALLIVDPLVAYLGAADSHRDADVRTALEPLAALADEERVAVLAIRHLNKSGGPNPLYRGGGSIGLIAAARSGLLVATDPDDPHGDRRVLAATKANLAPKPAPLAYYLETIGGTVRIAWEGETDLDAYDLLEIKSREERTLGEEAETFILGELAEGPRKVQELQEAADDLGLAWKTVQAAKGRLPVESEKKGFGKDGFWVWKRAEEAPKADGPGEASTLGGENSEDPHDSRESPKVDPRGALDPKVDQPSTLGSGPARPGDSADGGPKVDAETGPPPSGRAEMARLEEDAER